VLVVDDEPAGVLILSQALKGAYEIVSAANGHEALARARDLQTQPDIILLDVQMPGMDGFGVCRTLTADPRLKDIPILFLTSLDDVVCKTQAFDAGAVDYITKPYHLPEVLARVRTHLSLKQAREDLRQNELKFRQLSVTDDLTGLYNTRFLYQGLTDALQRCEQDGAPLACVFMDMDHFKRVVDTHGHLFGSIAIQEVAATIQGCLEPPAFAVSYAGDEFVIVLPGADKDKARELVLLLQQRMADTSYLSSRGLHLRLSASFGVAAFPEDGREPKVLLAAADHELFASKKRRGVGRKA